MKRDQDRQLPGYIAATPPPAPPLRGLPLVLASD